MDTTSKQSTLQLLEAVRDALATSLNRQQQIALTQVGPEIIDYYAGLARCDSKASH